MLHHLLYIYHYDENNLKGQAFTLKNIHCVVAQNTFLRSVHQYVCWCRSEVLKGLPTSSPFLYNTQITFR